MLGVDGLDLTERGELVGGLLAELVLVDWARDSGRRAYGSAVAGRLNSARRGFMPGRIGADDKEERGAPVGTVRVVLAAAGGFASGKAG